MTPVGIGVCRDPTRDSEYWRDWVGWSFLRCLRRAREKAGLSQSEVARRLARPQSFVSKCESGERRVDLVEMRAFARIYGIRAIYFLEEGR